MQNIGEGGISFNQAGRLNPDVAMYTTQTVGAILLPTISVFKNGHLWDRSICMCVCMCVNGRPCFSSQKARLACNERIAYLFRWQCMFPQHSLFLLQREPTRFQHVREAVNGSYSRIDSLPASSTGTCRALLRGEAPDYLSMELCNLQISSSRRVPAVHVGKPMAIKTQKCAALRQGKGWQSTARTTLATSS